MARPGPPEGLGEPGRALWRAIVADLAEGWMLDGRELELLRLAARCADEMALLEAAVDSDGAMIEGSAGQQRAHPGLGEARQLRLAQLRLLSALELSDPASAAGSSSPVTVRARRAAQARWATARVDVA